MPTGIVAVTAPSAGSIRDTLGSSPLSNSEFTTHTLSNPAAMPIGSPPTGTRASSSSGGGVVGVAEGVGDADDPASPSDPPQAANRSAVAAAARTERGEAGGRDAIERRRYASRRAGTRAAQGTDRFVGNIAIPTCTELASLGSAPRHWPWRRATGAAREGAVGADRERGRDRPTSARGRDALGLLVGTAGVVATAAIARRGLPETEHGVFRAANELPTGAYPVLWAPMQYGTMGTAPALAAVAALRGRRRLALSVVASGVIAWTVAKGVKEIVRRERPARILRDVRIRGEDEGTSASLRVTPRSRRRSPPRPCRSCPPPVAPARSRSRASCRSRACTSALISPSTSPAAPRSASPWGHSSGSWSAGPTAIGARDEPIRRGTRAPPAPLRRTTSAPPGTPRRRLGVGRRDRPRAGDPREPRLRGDRPGHRVRHRHPRRVRGHPDAVAHGCREGAPRLDRRDL